ncbi:leucine-rich repeat protein [Anaerosacchariphilus polymeriproducens]|uniref:BIG2 domain-containing protein n=1 Tax=Anaerosacchariphilus polymeriproducens TaxID=1812858 RepID=A0A371ATN4_9FIRM|nr:leucine-rich repeat protein [Anaerosacchariphilus polymeriproducens]RDU22911.1 hypothetical protein DWV06_11080 [Anaerosacchariphilus polymeriproducens]
MRERLRFKTEMKGKRVSFSVIVMLIIFLVIPVFKMQVEAATDNREIKGIRYTFDSSTDSYIVTSASSSIETAQILEEIGGKKVSSIYQGAFQYREYLTSVEIPGSIINIGKNAFLSCQNLRNVELSEGIGIIESSAFLNCKNLTNIHIPSSVRVVGESAFQYCDNLKSVTISNGVTTIQDSAFGWCDSLEYLSLPESVSKIGDGIVYDCTALKKINVEASNPKFCSINGVVYNKDKTILVLYPCGNTAKEYTILNGVKTIGNCGFISAQHLVKVNLPKGLTTIGEGAFFGCENLDNVNVPSSVATIGESAYGMCYNLTNITIPESVKNFGITVFYDDKKVIIYCVKNSNAHKYAVDNKLFYKFLETSQKPGSTTIKIKGIRLKEKSKTLDLKSCYQIKTTIIPSNASDKQVIYKSNNSRVASVNSRGKVTAKKIGKAVITITAKDGSRVTSKIAITVRPKSTKLKVKKLSKRMVKLTWKRVSDSSGYEIYRSTKRKIGYKKIATIKKAKIISRKNKKLKRKKTYYYKIRVYKIVKGKKIYSKYSTIKKVKM